MLTSVNIAQAKKAISNEMRRLGLPQCRLSARTIGFSDLARASMIFVRIHGWNPDPRAQDIENVARAGGFGVEFS